MGATIHPDPASPGEEKGLDGNYDMVLKILLYIVCTLNVDQTALHKLEVYGSHNNFGNEKFA